MPYEILNFQVWPWSYSEHENQYVYVAETLRKAMTTNPYLKVFVANGYYDLATPYFATEYTFSHLGLDEVAAREYQHGLLRSRAHDVCLSTGACGAETRIWQSSSKKHWLNSIMCYETDGRLNQKGRPSFCLQRDTLIHTAD